VPDTHLALRRSGEIDDLPAEDLGTTGLMDAKSVRHVCGK